MNAYLAKALDKAADFAAPVTKKVAAKSPEILLVGGIAVMIGGTVVACRTTWKKLPDRIDEKDADIWQKEEELGDSEDAQSYKPIAYAKMCGKIALDYTPAALMIIGGTSMVVCSHNQLRGRIAALGAAYATLESMYAKYRSRVIDDYGFEKDRQYRLGIYEEEVTTTKKLKNGKEKEITEVVETIHPDGTEYSMYARYFDQYNSNMHVKNQESNYDFLRMQQNIANEKLQRRGYLFLNEVYDALGFKQVPEGQLVGWVKGMGDDFVDFGLYEARNADARNYVDFNGKETCFVLDFNVVGLMWDLI